MPNADTPAALAALDPDLERKARSLATDFLPRHAEEIDLNECTTHWRTDRDQLREAADVILALLAAARQGEEDTTLTAVRAWFDAWADWPTTMSRDEAARLPEWDAMIDALGYDRDERRSAARAASQHQEVSRDDDASESGEEFDSAYWPDSPAPSPPEVDR